MSKGESRNLDFGTNEAKRFFQWILGCTYARKTIKTRWDRVDFAMSGNFQNRRNVSFRRGTAHYNLRAERRESVVVDCWSVSALHRELAFCRNIADFQLQIQNPRRARRRSQSLVHPRSGCSKSSRVLPNRAPRAAEHSDHSEMSVSGEGSTFSERNERNLSSCRARNPRHKSRSLRHLLKVLFVRRFG